MGKVATEDTLKLLIGDAGLIAAKARSEMSISQIANLIRMGDLSSNESMFPIGSEITVPWRDMEDENRNTETGAYKTAWTVMGHGKVKLSNGREVNGMYIKLKRALPFPLTFSCAREAFCNAGEGMSAGTYSVMTGAEAINGFPANKLIEFTLQSPVPANGRLRMGNISDSNGSCLISSYAADGINPIESVNGSVVEASEGTYLGRLGEGELNDPNRARYGYGRYGISAIRQFLNSDGENWFSSKDKFDLPPDYAGRHGFLSGFDAEFLEAVRKTEVKTLSFGSDGTSNTESVYDGFFLPSLEQMGVTPAEEGQEGEAFLYARKMLGTNGFISKTSSPAPTYDFLKTSALGAEKQSVGVFFRSAHPSRSAFVYGAQAAGYVYSGGLAAGVSMYVSPAGVIC